MAQNFHNNILKRMLEVGIGTDIKAALYDGGTLNKDHNFMSDLDGTEVSTTGYQSPQRATGFPVRTTTAMQTWMAKLILPT